MTTIEKPKKKRNDYISYVKGFALITIVIVHLVHWSNIKVGPILKYIMEVSSVGILLFMSMIGVVVIYAYGKYEDFKKPTKRLLQRAFILLLIYFAYNIIKFYLFPYFGFYDKQPFYWQFTERGTLDLMGILTLKSFTVPITVFVLIPILLLISIGVLYINRLKYKKTIIGSLIIFFYILNYWTRVPTLSSLNFLYGINTSMLSINYWLLPYFIGVFIAMLGFEKIKYQALGVFSILTIIFGLQNYYSGYSIWPQENIYPLKPYYVTFSFLIVYIVIIIVQLIEKLKNKISFVFLAFLKFLGNHTFNLYVYHWIAIDLTIRFIN
ncbi:MAG: hypothetical protein PHR68_03225, partial [Candidatus Gracilibacteria bacterium]|nr:hypothetical protein [Candidatus Gracilibacteria bacterium]